MSGPKQLEFFHRLLRRIFCQPQGCPQAWTPPLHSTAEPSSLQRLRAHRPVLPTPAPCEEQKLLASIRKCVCLHVKSHICIQQIKTLSVVQMH